MKKLMTVVLAMLFAASTGVAFAQAKGDAKDAKKADAKAAPAKAEAKKDEKAKK